MENVMTEEINYPPYPCWGGENPGIAVLTDASGNYVNAIYASRCFLDWYCPPNNLTWEWRDGIDPDDPSTWPPEPEPTEPPQEP